MEGYFQDVGLRLVEPLTKFSGIETGLESSFNLLSNAVNHKGELAAAVTHVYGSTGQASVH